MTLIDRVRNILLQPGKEWEVIAGERTSVAELYQGYIVPLAAIGPVASIVGFSVFGITLPILGTHRVPLMSAVGHAAVSFALTLAMVFVLALIIDALAPTFGGHKNRDQALKVATYSGTPGWLGGIFLVHPALALLGVLLSVYGLYLLYRGLPIVLGTGPNRGMLMASALIAYLFVAFVSLLGITVALWGSGVGPLIGA